MSGELFAKHIEIIMSEKPTVIWYISCFDKRKENPLPLTTRTFCLDWSKVPNDAAKDIMNILKDSEPPAAHFRSNTGDTTETISYSTRNLDSRILKYRHLFIDCDVKDIYRQLEDPNSPIVSIKSVKYNPEYFEDQNGRQMTQLDIIKYVTGKTRPVIAGNVESILALGVSDPKDKEKWTLEKANTIAHFFQIVKLIYNSSWQRSRLSLTATSSDQDSKKIRQPSIEVTCSVLVLFRQLYSTKDKLFENAYEYYIKHVSDDLKIAWVKERKNAFDALLNNPPSPFQISEYSTKKFIDVFLYGSGLIHPMGDNLRTQSNLKDLIEKFGKEKVAFTIHSCFRQLLAYAIDIYHVIKQDYFYWVKEKGYIGPDIVDVYELLSSNLNHK